MVTGFPSDELPAESFWPLLLVLVIRGGLGGLFLISGFSKLRRPATFRRTVRTYRLVPEPAVPAVAYLVIAFEMFVGLWLLVGVAKVAALLGASAMLAGFAAAIAVNLVRGRSFDCGCYGLELRTPISWRHVVQNSALAVIAALAAAVVPGVEVPLVPSLVVMSAGIAVPAIIISERRVRQLTPYRIRPTLRLLAEMHGASGPNGGVQRGEFSSTEVD